MRLDIIKKSKAILHLTVLCFALFLVEVMTMIFFPLTRTRYMILNEIILLIVICLSWWRYRLQKKEEDYIPPPFIHPINYS